jgi:hypothetical protein
MSESDKTLELAAEWLYDFDDRDEGLIRSFEETRDYYRAQALAFFDVIEREKPAKTG